MKRLSTMMRARELELENKRRVLADLEARRDNLMGELAGSRERLVAEQNSASASLEGRAAYPAFVHATRLYEARIRHSLSLLGGQIEAAHEDVAHAFGELKRLQVLQEKKAEAERLEGLRREQAESDDIALGRHVRRSR